MGRKKQNSQVPNHVASNTDVRDVSNGSEQQVLCSNNDCHTWVSIWTSESQASCLADNEFYCGYCSAKMINTMKSEIESLKTNILKLSGNAAMSTHASSYCNKSQPRCPILPHSIASKNAKSPISSTGITIHPSILPNQSAQSSDVTVIDHLQPSISFVVSDKSPYISTPHCVSTSSSDNPLSDNLKEPQIVSQQDGFCQVYDKSTDTVTEPQIVTTNVCSLPDTPRPVLPVSFLNNLHPSIKITSTSLHYPSTHNLSSHRLPPALLSLSSMSPVVKPNPSKSSTASSSIVISPTHVSRPPLRKRFASRDRCVIVTNITPSNSLSPQARLDHDVSAFRSILSSIVPADKPSFFQDISPVAFIRLNKSSQSNPSQPPLLKIVFKHRSHASSVLSQRFKLMSSSTTRIFPDRAPSEIAQISSARIEKRRREENGETSLAIRNIDGNFQIVHTRPKIRWRSISPMCLLH
ncbi:hypothetical protein GJ496_001650 [Pomphorhynchus laevis]|nr:hypothetical protein GJ496_001650 [Pomphorhynchus laevis]